MALRKPGSSKEVRYFTRKRLENGGKAMIWVFNPICPECGKEGLRIPFDEKTRKFKSRARNFECMYCGYEVPKKEVKEKTPMANISYKCPHCGFEGEKQEPFERTKSTKTFYFECDKCNKKIKVGGKKKKK